MATTIKDSVFILPLRDQVVFPALRTSVTLQHHTYRELCEFFETQRPPSHVGVVAASSKAKDGLPRVGTFCSIASNGQSTMKVGREDVIIMTMSLEGQERFEVKEYQVAKKHLAKIEIMSDRSTDRAAETKLSNELKQLVQKLVEENNRDDPHLPSERPLGASLATVFRSSKGKISWPASHGTLADMVTAGLGQLSLPERQQVLEAFDVKYRLELVLRLMNRVMEVQELSRQIKSSISKTPDDELRETVLRRQLGEWQRELRSLRGSSRDIGDDDATAAEGDKDLEDDDITNLAVAVKEAQMSPEAFKVAQRELRRLQHIQPHHPEHTSCRTYLETLTSLPWTKATDETVDVQEAQDMLEQDHYGLEVVKQRILEFLAVRKMRRDTKGPILCLHGPPGVGKTSLGRSIARALGRKFQRLSLGGLRDEAELRGHRRTYIGSMPGSIMQALISAKVRNPVILLDEIDKVTHNSMFNPSGALLELLDPEQNFSFKDHYVNTPFDLSEVLFLCTCNDLSTIDRPLLDRMEIIDLPGYTVEEKVHIARTHLLPKQRKLHALEHEPSASKCTEEDGHAASQTVSREEPKLSLTEAAITDLVVKWTMESGVRSLERRVAQVCRWAALRLANANEEERVGHAALRLDPSSPSSSSSSAAGIITVDAPQLPSIVGPEVFVPDLASTLDIGVAVGLGVTAVGGQILFVEAKRNRGSGRLTITGQLGEVMRESVTTSLSLLKSKLFYATRQTSQAPAESGSITASSSSHPPPDALRTAPLFALPSAVELMAKAEGARNPFSNDDLHVHFPSGSIPKDGPSCGVATTLALASLILNRPVRSDTAVTGEITLRGHVLPVGGIRDKVLAAHRAGLRHVLLPSANRRQALEELPAALSTEPELHFVKNIDEALEWAFATEAARSSYDQAAAVGVQAEDQGHVSAQLRARL